MLRKPKIALAVLAGLALAYPGVTSVPFASAGQIAQNNVIGRMNYRELAHSAVHTLLRLYYTGAGSWNMCVPAVCARRSADWGADSLTYTLYLRWQLTGSPAARPVMTALARTARLYTASDDNWSDGPEWDAVADVREYQVAGNPTALRKAEAAFALVDSTGAARFALGACPAIDYQQANGAGGGLKTLETDSNYVKAALLLYQVTRDRTYLAKAERKYQAARKYFLSPGSSLYTAHVIDKGGRCVRVPALYFASVNGNMIWDGATLADATGTGRYLAQSVATARAVGRILRDGTGVFTDLQTEADVVEPLVEGMYLLASGHGEAFARTWLLGAASAATADRTKYGTYGRFFNGPPPRGPVTAWQGNGGLAVMIAAARLDPGGLPRNPWYWRHAVFVPDSRVLPAGPQGAVRFSLTGRAVAIIGNLGAPAGMHAHARILIDGKPMADRVGIFQGKFSGSRVLSRQVLFAWRWRHPRSHRITITAAPGAPPGSTYFKMSGFYVVH
jgi:hypothetical protein